MKMKQQTLAVVFFTILILFFYNPIFADTNTHGLNNSEEDFSLTLTTEITETYCGGCVGAIDLTVSGGQMPYTFSWSNSATTEDIDGLCIGVYNVTVTDATGCTETTNPFVGQNNYPNVELESQAEVDAYVDNFSFCGVVPGVLRIGTTFSDPPSDITDISGLSFITSVGSNLFIFQNPNLTSLDGLQGITSIGNSVNITSNGGLTDLTGFPNITAINGSLRIDFCANLQSLNGLNQITSIDGDVYLAEAYDLTSLAPLSNLQTVNGELDIRICTSLTNFDGLENLTTINGDLVIRDNPILTDISGLDHAIAISGNLEIQNTDLSNCSIIPICEMLGNGASGNISNNANGCNSSVEIIMACESELFSINMESTPSTCFGLCDGIITANITGGTPPFVYAWSTGALNMVPVLPNLCAGDYTVTVTDNEGVEVIAAITTMDPEPIETFINIISTECFQDCGFEVIITTTGGTPPYSYSGLPDEICVETNYTLTVTDANGCIQNQSFLFLAEEPFDVALSNSGDDINSLSNGFFDITIGGGNAPFSFEWFLNGMVVSTDEDPTNLSAGDYDLVVTDANGCSQEFGPFTIDAITGLEEISNMDVQIFPVPAKDNIRVQFDTPVLNKVPYTLWNVSGALMKSGNILDDGMIDLEDLGSGVYFLKMEVDGGILVGKLVKE